MGDKHVVFERAVLVPSQWEVELRTITLAVAAFPNKVGNLLMKALGAVAPLTELKHLKRVRKAPDDGTLLEAILCVQIDDVASESAHASSTNDSTSTDAPSGDVPDAGRLPVPLQALYHQYGGLRLRLMPAAAAPPQTRQQWEAWTKLWPITWRIPDNGIPVTEETPVDARTQSYFEQHMRAALHMASVSVVDNAAVIVDPAVQVAVSEAADNSAVHPLQHAVMAAVQAASERDLAQWSAERASVDPYGGSSGVDPMDIAGHDVANVEDGTDRHLQGASSPRLCVLEHRQNVISCGEDAGPRIVGKDDEAATDELACKRPRLGAGPQDAQQASTRSRPYMCTGYDCFVVREPCIMCAMALVHSRVQRVIYCQPDAVFGALGGCRRLHACKSLNHNYEVYRLELKREG